MVKKTTNTPYSLLSLIFILLHSVSFQAKAQETTVSSPDEQLRVTVLTKEGQAFYTVSYKGNVFLEPSPLGLITNEGSFESGLTLTGNQTKKIEKKYQLKTGKQSDISYAANQLSCTFENEQKKKLAIVFQVSNNDIAFRYELPTWGERRSCVIKKEKTGYDFPAGTTTFLSNMMAPMTGFARTAPSYESGYEADGALGKTTRGNRGYVFPGLFRLDSKGWILLSETGVRGTYCGSHLSDGTKEGLYTVEYPDPAQNNGFGSTGAAISLPGETPWRTITIGETLKPITETTISTDVVEPLYQPSINYKHGKSTWSWIVWQDNSMNYEDQSKYIDLAAAMGYEYILIDALWDTNIGKERMEKLIRYAGSKNVGVFLWYNSNGPFNDAPQGPRNKMSAAIERKEEMKWLKKAGVKGLKVDFFGGDKQETMRLYEDILSDANDHELMVIFHGTTLPRGWDRMFPNFAGSEAVVASEMLIFSQGVRESEAFNATLHPFIRNAVGSMEFGGVFLNKFLTKSNAQRNERLTTDAFQLATAVLFQNPVQMFALTPNNLTDAPAFAIDFMKKVPTLWDETVFIDGYPGKHAVLARRHGKDWYVAGVNATKEPLKLKLELPMLAGSSMQLAGDNAKRESISGKAKISNKGTFEITIQPGGGFVLHPIEK